MTITLYINGNEKILDCQPGDMLTEVLRKAGYVEVKKGCDTANCGACTVLIEDKPILSCSYLAVRADGKRITTIQGVAEEAKEFARFLTAEGRSMWILRTWFRSYRIINEERAQKSK